MPSLDIRTLSSLVMITGALRQAVAASVVLFATGCASLAPPPDMNHALHAVNPDYGYRFTNLKHGTDNGDGLFVVLSFSGGGTRSAALAYGVLEKLRDTPIEWDGGKKRLLDEVDVINSVSGGSYAAAYYGLYRDDFFTSFPERFLNADFQSELWDQYVSMTGLAQFLGWSRNDRVDRLSALIARRLFGDKTFADLLARRERPLVVIHATDLTLGADFQFTQDQLDPLCTDLSSFPVARAVAASSAVPILFGPVTLKNHAGTCGYMRPAWLKQISNLPADQTWSLRARRHANDFLTYLDADPKTGRPWIHLIDGGVADNLGLRGPLESGLIRGGLAPLLKRLGVKGIRKLVFMVVSAEVAPELTADRSGESPSTKDMASSVIDAFMNNISFETMTWLRSSIRFWRDEAREQAKSGGSPYANDPDFYLIEVNLRDIKDPAERTRMMAVPTTFKLAPEQIGALVKHGHELLQQAPEFQRLVKDLK